jgi:hypothetical protein
MHVCLRMWYVIWYLRIFNICVTVISTKVNIAQDLEPYTFPRLAERFLFGIWLLRTMANTYFWGTTARMSLGHGDR